MFVGQLPQPETKDTCTIILGFSQHAERAAGSLTQGQTAAPATVAVAATNQAFGSPPLADVASMLQERKTN